MSAGKLTWNLILGNVLVLLGLIIVLTGWKKQSSKQTFFGGLIMILGIIFLYYAITDKLKGTKQQAKKDQLIINATFGILVSVLFLFTLTIPDVSNARIIPRVMLSLVILTAAATMNISYFRNK